MGKRLVTGELKYYERPQNLMDFVSAVDKVPIPTAKFWAPDSEDEFHQYSRKNPTDRYTVEVRRGKSKVVSGYANQGGFATTGKKFLATRKNETTWNVRPNPSEPEGDREGRSSTLFAMGLAQMAANIFEDASNENGGSLQQQFDKMQNNLADAYVATFGA
jgi:hypothetical protein